MKTVKKALSVFICFFMVFATFAVPAGADSVYVTCSNCFGTGYAGGRICTRCNGKGVVLTLEKTTVTSKMKKAKLWEPNTKITLKNSGNKTQHVYKRLNIPSGGRIRILLEDPYAKPSANITLYDKEGYKIHSGDFSPTYKINSNWINVPKGTVYADIAINSGENLKKLYYLYISDSGKHSSFSLSMKEGSKKDLSVYLKNLSGTPKWESYEATTDGDGKLDGYPAVKISSKGVATTVDYDSYTIVRAYYKNGNLGEFVIYVYDKNDDWEYFFDNNKEDEDFNDDYEDTDFDDLSGGHDYYGDDDDDDYDYSSPSTPSTPSTPATPSDTTPSSGSKNSNGTYTYKGSLGKSLTAGAGYAATYSKLSIKDAASGGSYALTIPSPLDYAKNYKWNSQSKEDGQITTHFSKDSTGSLDDAASYISALKKLGFSVRTQKDESSYRLYGLDYNGSASITHGGVKWVWKFDLAVYVSYSAGKGDIFVYTPTDIGFKSSSSSGTQTLDTKKAFTCRYDNYGRVIYDMSGVIKGCNDNVIIALDTSAYKKGDTLTLSDFKKSGNSGSSAKCMFNILGDTFTTSSWEASPDISAYSKINVKILDKVNGYYIIGFDAALTSKSKTLEIQGVAVPDNVKAASGSSDGITPSPGSGSHSVCQTCRGTGDCRVCGGSGKASYWLGGGAYKYHPDCTACHGSGDCSACGGDGYV